MVFSFSELQALFCRSSYLKFYGFHEDTLISIKLGGKDVYFEHINKCLVSINVMCLCAQKFWCAVCTKRQIKGNS